MKTVEALAIFAEANAIITGTHVVYTSGKHGSAYVNKDAVYPNPTIIADLCMAIATSFIDDQVEVVVGPAVGGVILAQWTAYNLRQLTGDKVLGVYAEKPRGQEGFVITRGYDKIVADKRVLVVEDILNTGGSAKAVVEVVRATGGIAVGLGALCNRGSVTAEELGVPKLFSLVEVEMEAWEETDCPLCKSGVPINLEVGHGRDFLARRQAAG